MLSVDEMRRRFGQVFAAPPQGVPSVSGSNNGHEPRFYSRLRGIPTVEAYQAGEALHVSPFFIANESLDGPVARIEGRETLMFGSNNYLGLTRHPDVMKAARDALDTYGTSCTGSRLLNGTIAPHVQFEEEIADFLGYPKAILFTTGFMANQGAISSLCRRGDQVFSDRDNHASIVDGLTGSGVQYYMYAHNDCADLDSKLVQVGGGTAAVGNRGFGVLDVRRDRQVARTHAGRSQHGAWFIWTKRTGSGRSGRPAAGRRSTMAWTTSRTWSWAH